MASRRRDDSFTDQQPANYDELPVRRSGRDRHNLLYNSLDENIMQTPLFQHILGEANNSRHHGLYSTTTSPSRSQNASNSKQPAPPPSTSSIRRTSALLARERLTLHRYADHPNARQQDEEEEDPDFESNRYSFRSRQPSMKEYHRNNGKKNRSQHHLYDEVSSFSPTPKSVHSEEEDEVPMDENKHAIDGRARKSIIKSMKNKSISPKDMNAIGDGRRLSSRVANQSMRTQLLRRSGGLGSTDYKSGESDGYVANKKALQPLERLAIEEGGDSKNFGLTMYERVKSQPRQRQCRRSFQVSGVEYMEEVAGSKPLLNRPHNQQDYQPQVKRSRYSRERASRVVIDDGEDENSRETVDSNDNNEHKSVVEASNLNEEEEEDAPRQYPFRQRRAPPTQQQQQQQIVHYSTDRPVRNCRMNMSISASAGVYGRAVSENRIKFSSSSRAGGKHSSRRSISRHGRRSSHRRRHGSSDSSSTSSSSSDEAASSSANRPSNTIKSAKQDARQEARFERRKLKSLAKGRRNLMPMNLTEKEIASSSSMYSREKLRKLGSSCADIDPMQIDNKVGFEQIGGLTKHIQSLKEVVVFPMLYPEYFQQFDVSPPKGVLFYGPPGTGKTLVARALANECSKDGQKVAFFMRKGADCLSKWVGESERQLRLLFDQAYTMRPSIIFFDEIDGLAPVRSSKQDQIHSSIVSTLLALMDGLDKRGEIIVIGATNRLDSIDPALRRPGRFDREMRFDLPDKTAREAILKIHTSSWKECQPDDHLLQWLADQSSGYCGADLRALCTEAVLVALRESFPHIYLSSEKLVIDPSKVKISRQHFMDSLRQIVPAARRDMCVMSHQLNERSSCLIQDFIECTMANRIPKGYVQRTDCVENLYKTDLERVVMGLKTPPSVPAARLLLHGHGQLGLSTHYLPVLLNRLDHLPVFPLSSESIYCSGSPEENVSQAIKSALRTTAQGTAAVVLLPDIDVLQTTLPPHLWRMLMSSLHAFSGLTPVLLLASLQQHYSTCSQDIKQLFRLHNAVEVKCPTEPQRKTYYKKLLDKATQLPVEFNAALYPVPEKAPKEVPIRKVSAEEYKELRNTYNQMLRQLRMFLRDILARLIRDRRFAAFQMPVDKEDAEDYYEIIEKPMCLTQIMSKIDSQEYEKVEAFMEDIQLIKFNALEYNPDKNLEGKTMRHNATALVDAAEELLALEYENTFSERLEEFKKLLAEAKAGGNALEKLPSTPLDQPAPKQPAAAAAAAKPTFVKHPNNPKKPQMGRRGRKKQGRVSAIPLNTTSNTLALDSSKRRRTAPASLLTHLSIVKKYNKLQKNSSLRSTQKSEEDEEENNQQLSRKNSPPMLEDSLPVPELGSEAPTTSNDLFKQLEQKSGQSSIGNQRKELRIDERLMKVVLNQCVEKTQNWSIPDMECLGAVLTQTIDQFADKWDRHLLPEQLEKSLRSYVL